jgi:hypothetical protein
MADSKPQFYNFLLSLGIDQDDATAAANRYDNAIKEIQKGVPKSISTQSNSTGGVIGTIAAGFIDQQIQNFGRISTSTAQDIIKGIQNTASLNPLTIISGILNNGLLAAERIITDLAVLDKELIERVRGAGGYVGDVAKIMKVSISEAMIAAQQYGVATNDTLDAAQSLMKNGERMAIYGNETIATGMIASLAFTDSSKKILENAENFRNVGIGLDGASKSITDIGLKSINMGLSAKATSETLIANLGKLNEFGFQKGIKGLGKMVQEAQALKINIESTFKVAERLYDPEAAINLAANLQVVGGAFGDLGDPIKLMYDATNNVESLQTSIIGAARSLATYNVEQGRFEVTGVNLRRAKAMGDALGMTMSEMTNMAVKGAAKFEAMSKIDIFPDISEEQKEFVSNLATMKDGKVGFDLPKNMIDALGITSLKDGFVDLDNLSSQQLVQLQELQKSADKEEPIDVARNQFNETTKILNVASAIYLRMLNDGKNTPTGDFVAENMKKASAFMQTINPSQNNTGQMVSKAANMATEGADSGLKFFNDNLSPQVKDFIDKAQKVLMDKVNNIELPSINEILKKGSDIKQDIQEVLEPIFKNFTGSVNLKVDVNGNNPLLANMVIDEILKNPQTRANFMNIITKPENTYT